MYLKHLTWRETEQYLQQKQSIIMPIGSHEQHGPNGMIGTDIICPVRVAEDLSQETGILIGPPSKLVWLSIIWALPAPLPSAPLR